MVHMYTESRRDQTCRVLVNFESENVLSYYNTIIFIYILLNIRH